MGKKSAKGEAILNESPQPSRGALFVLTFYLEPRVNPIIDHETSLLVPVINCSSMAKAKKASKKKSAKKAAKKSSGKRELIAPRGDKRYIRRDRQGRITESDDQGKSLSQDRRRKAKTKAKPGQGDKGDRSAD